MPIDEIRKNLKTLQHEIEAASGEPYNEEDINLVANVLEALETTQGDDIFERLNTLRLGRKMSEQSCSLIWDIGRTLGLTDKQAGELAGDPTDEEIEQQRKERQTRLAKESEARWAELGVDTAPTVATRKTWRDDPATDPQRGRFQRLLNNAKRLGLKPEDVEEIEIVRVNDDLSKGAASDIIEKHPPPGRGGMPGVRKLGCARRMPQRPLG